MTNIPFVAKGDRDSCFYALAWCEAFHVQRKGNVPVGLGMYVTFDPSFSRFSYWAFDASEGRRQFYLAGPTYSKGVEAALLLGSVSLEVPPFSWRLFPSKEVGPFALSSDQEQYQQARAELCIALYDLRMAAWAQRSANLSAPFVPPAGGFIPADAYAASAENQEIMRTKLAAQ